MRETMVKQSILDGKTALGIEFGSTRIKAVLIGEDASPIASGSHDWENQLVNGIWTYSLDAIWHGLQDCYANLAKNVKDVYDITLTSVGAIGFSAMMHGYMAFDASWNQLVPFRTWRNTMTEQAASALTDVFSFNIPQRWSIAHLYQAMLNGEVHVGQIAHLTTLAGYVHKKLSGENVMGIGEASGMFPIDSKALDYDGKMLEAFDALHEAKMLSHPLKELLPRVLDAGQSAGALTAEGAKLLDPSGNLQAGIPMCPPEGDAGTGMVATNSIAEKTGNVSAGTSVFAMVVLEKALSKVYTEIDMVTTPDGKPVAMVHCNNCCSDIDAWMNLFDEVLDKFGVKVDKSTLYQTLYQESLTAKHDAGGLISYNYLSGEPVTQLEQGRPLLMRLPDAKMTLANFMRTQLYGTMATLKLGMDILTEKEHVSLNQLLGHGGLFKVQGVAQKYMASAMNVPVVVMETAGEGGAWGIAILAAYRVRKTTGMSLQTFMETQVFASSRGSRIEPDAEIAEGFLAYMQRYQAGLAAEKAAAEFLV